MNNCKLNINIKDISNDSLYNLERNLRGLRKPIEFKPEILLQLVQEIMHLRHVNSLALDKINFLENKLKEN